MDGYSSRLIDATGETLSIVVSRSLSISLLQKMLRKMRNDNDHDEGTLLVSHISSRGCLPAFADEALNVGASITFSESMKYTSRQTLPRSSPS